MPISSPKGKGNGLLDIKSNHIFITNTERDNYFITNPSEIKENLYVYNNSKLQKYESGQWVDRTPVVQGDKGDIGEKGTSIQSITDIESNKIRITLDDGTNYDVTKTQASANNITVSKTDFTNLLKNFTGNQTQELFNFIDEINQLPNGEFYFGEINTENSWKIIKENSNLNFYRYDLYNNQYNKIASFGTSVESDKFILTEWQGKILGTKADGTMRTLLKTSVDKDGVIIGNKIGRVGLVHGSRLFSMYPTGISSDFKMNNCTDAEGTANAQTISNFSTYFKATIDGFYSGFKNLDIIEAPEGTTARFWATSEDKEDIIVESCSYMGFTKGLGKNIIIGLNDLLLDEPFPIDKDTAVYFNLEFSNPVKLKGSIVDNGIIDDPKFYPMCDVIKETANMEDLATQDWSINKFIGSSSLTSNSEETFATSKAVKILNDNQRALVSGRTPPIFISVEDFNALTSGLAAEQYILTNSGLLVGRESDGMYYKDSTIIIKADFTARTIIADDYTVNNSGGSSATDILFITNVITPDIGKNVSVTKNIYPADESVQTITTDATNVTVTVLWIFNKDSICPIPTVNGVSVSNISSRNGSVYTGTATIDITEATNITATLGTTSYMIGLTKETPPVIQSVTFGDYPINQASVKENDTMEITITADKSFNQVIVDNFELAKSKIQNVTEGTSATISISCANRGLTTTTIQKVRVMVVSPTGSSSGSYTSSTGIMMNNSVPSLTIGTKTYPDGQEALKGTESCTVNFTTNNADVVTPTSPNGQLTIGTQTATSLIVNRLSGDYNDSTTNLSFALKFNENQATATVTTIINIANIAPLLNSATSTQVRSGVGDVSIPCTYDQKIKITSVTIGANKGTLNSATSTSTYSTTYTGLISASDMDDHSLSNVNMTIEIVGMSGLTATVNRQYFIKGFGNKVLTYTFPEYEKSIGTTVVDPFSVVCSGTLNVTNPVTVATIYDSSGNLDDVREFGLINSNTTLKLSGKLTDFYYDTGVTVTINISEN